MNRKLLLSLGTVAAIAAPVTSVISCGSTSTDSVTIVVPRASSMNFIRYKAASNLAAPTVLPLSEGAATESIKNKYQLKGFKMSSKNGGVMTINGWTYGAIVPAEKGETFSLDQSGKNITMIIRSNMRWSNGDKLVAENWVDTIKAMLDLNNASEYVNSIERMGLENATEAYDAQIEYFKQNKKPYDDPFNYKELPVYPEDSSDNAAIKKWNSEKAAGNPVFPKILNPCLNLGVESDGANKILLHFNHKESLTFIQSVQSPVFWPINRDFIMKNGGFDKFGEDANTMVSSGAYQVSYFDSKYGVEFKQNKKYYNAGAVITPHINFRFVKNTNTVAALFESGKVLLTPVGKDYISKYLSTPGLRDKSTRTAGVGTLAMFLNRSKTATSSNHKELFDNANFRKALFYGIDRSQLLPALQLPFSNPVGLYTASVATTQDYESYMGMYRDTEYNAAVTDKDGKQVGDSVEKPMLTSPPEARKYSYSQDFFKRSDNIFDPVLARKYLEQAEKELGHSVNVTLSYPYDSSDPIGKSVSIVLQDFLTKTFGNKIKIEPKALPTIVYSQYINTGKWDMQIKQVDPLTRKPWDYLGEFVEPDDVDPSEGLTTGFIKNNSGGATYKDYFLGLSEGAEEAFRKNYGFDVDPKTQSDPAVEISKFSYDVAKWFITYQDFKEDPTSEFSEGKLFGNSGLERIINEYADAYAGTKGKLSTLEGSLYKLIKEYYASELTPFKQIYDIATKAENDYESSLSNNKDSWTTVQKTKVDSLTKSVEVAAKKIIQSKVAFMESTIPYNVSFNTVYKVIEAIQRDMVPVIPLAEADNKWLASRAQGAATTAQGQWANPEYLYDADNKPYPWLEGVIK